jgi:histone H3/H4
MPLSSTSLHMKRLHFGAMKMLKEPTISRAAVRRLAHDARQKLTKQAYDEVLAKLSIFLRELIGASLRASEYARRKSITWDHVLFGVQALGLRLPAELRDVEASAMNKLLKCNLRAPADCRKQSALHAEVSEASFFRLSKQAANKCRENLRISSQARRFIQLISESRIVTWFQATEDTTTDQASDISTAQALAVSVPCSAPIAKHLVSVLLQISNQVPKLLSIRDTNTLDGRLVLAAGGGLVGPGITLTSVCSNTRLIKTCDRILRGRAADKRVTHSAAAMLATILTDIASTHLVDEITEAAGTNQ